MITAEGDDLLKIIFHYFTERFVLKQIEYPLGIRKSSATYHNSDRHSGINIVGIKQYQVNNTKKNKENNVVS